MPEILSSFDIFKGKKAKYSDAGSGINLSYPIQFILDKDKTPQWAALSINWIEQNTMIQMRRNINWMQKNYELMNNLIDKRDYIKDVDNEYFQLINRLTDENSATALRSVPFIQLIINTLTNEFTKRPSKIAFSMLDSKSMDEMFEDKETNLEKILLSQAGLKQQNKLLEMGLQPDSEQGKQMLDPQTLKSLPELQNFYMSNYRSMYQDWAEHQMVMDNDRFYENEMNRWCFKDMLGVDRCYKHFLLKETDYDIQRWNPKQVGYRKSPNERWIQNGQWVNHITLMSVPDVLDMYGWMMSEEQQVMLNQFYPARSASYPQDGLRPEFMYDPSQSYEYNRTGPGIGAKQLYSALGLNGDGTGDIVNQLLAGSEDLIDVSYTQMVRVSTTYWKTQRCVYELTTVDEEGNMKRDLVSDSYVVTDKPVYNTVVYKDKTSDNLVFGQHLDAIWVNEVWGGVKIGPNLPIYGWTANSNNFSPMYLGIRGGEPSKLPYQFCAGEGKDVQRWKPLLPVCGTIFSDTNVHSRSFVDALKIYQIGVNMTAMQILDLMIDELGVIVQLDPTAFPKHSMGEDWGPDPFAKGIQVMRDFSVLPQVRQIGENGQLSSGDHVKVLDLSQSNRFMTKMKLFEFFKNEGLAAVGLNPQRMGQPIDQEESGTGRETAIASSYSSTEHLFTQFDEFLVRYHKMRTDLAQFYNSTNPSVRLQYTTDQGMKDWFMLDGRDLDGRDFGVRCISSPHSRQVLNEIKQIILKNNTTDAGIGDLVRLAKVEVLADIDPLISDIERKQQEKYQQEQQAEQQQQQAEQQHATQMQQQQQQFIADQNQQDRQNKLEVAQITIAPKLADANTIKDNTNELSQNQSMHNDKMDLDRQKEQNKDILEKQKLELGKQKLNEESARTQAMVHEKKLSAQTKKKNDSK